MPSRYNGRAMEMMHKHSRLVPFQMMQGIQDKSRAGRADMRLWYTGIFLEQQLRAGQDAPEYLNCCCICRPLNSSTRLFACGVEAAGYLFHLNSESQR